MENDKHLKSECILCQITKLPITIITEIFAYSSNLPISFIHIISKSKKCKKYFLKYYQELIKKMI